MVEGRDAAEAQIGLGCLHLVPREAADHTMPLSRWGREVETALSAVPGVTGVEVAVTPAADGADPSFAEVAPWFAGGRAAGSGGHQIEIAFRLAVTRELLADLGPLYRGLGRWARDVRVRIVYVDDVPVIAAISREGHEEATGSTAVDIVRRHLERHLAAGPLVVDVLEPTPFPADLRVFARDDGDQLVAVSLHVQPGFDLIDVTVDTGESSFDDMLGHVVWQALLEADDYYRLVLGLEEAERLWDTIVTRFDAHVADQRRRGAWPWRSSSAAIRDLVLGFIETKAQVLAIWHDLAGRVEKARNSDVGLLSAHILGRYERLPAYPFDEYLRLLDFLEGRRTHSSDARIAIISAVIGGLIGSLYALFTGS